MFTIQVASVSELIPLRWRVLRPGRPESTAHFPGDTAPGTVHLVAQDREGTVIGCATVVENEGLQLRGMATAPEWRGKGVGRAVLEAVHALAHERGLPLWCNARESALPFYEKSGWQTEGERFEVPEVGPHFVMRWRG